jgi:hypothetical protein
MGKGSDEGPRARRMGCEHGASRVVAFLTRLLWDAAMARAFAVSPILLVAALAAARDLAVR